jgi:septal ring factor EnvC (AmiA/AmiB activator)
VSVLLALAVSAIPARTQTDYDREIKDSRTQLESLRKEAQAKRKRAQEFGSKERGVLTRLKEAEEALAATRKYIQRLDAAQTQLQEQIRKTAVDLSWAEGELEERKGELVGRLRHAYKHDRVRTLEFVFSAESFPSLLQRTAFLTRILDQDKKLIANVQARHAEVEQKLAALEEERTELAYLQREKQDEERKLTGLKEQRETELARVRNQKAVNERAARDLEKAARQMETVLAELERKRQDAMRRNNRVQTELDRLNFGNNRGRLPWPVSGKIITGFGRQQHPKYKTITMSNGIDIAAAPGTVVRAVGDGVVDLVDWLPGYGETVILNHGQGFYSIYGHLSSVAVSEGDRVSPEDILGTVGDTGSLKGPCLHFELRQGGTAQDPEAWLQ